LIPSLFLSIESGSQEDTMVATRRKVTKLLALALATAVGLSPSAASAGEPQTQGSPQVDQVLVIDQSQSMEKDKRLESAKQAAMLACAVLHGRIALISFSDEATVSPTFDLARQRPEAMRWIESLRTINGTHYVKAIEAVANLKPKAVVFLSDGEPGESPTEIMELVRNRLRSPLHTIAVQTSPKARDILGRMAATTKGGFHPIEQASEIVNTFLEILGQITRFRRFDLDSESLSLRDVMGELVTIGFDTIPTMSASTERLNVTLGSNQVHVARAIFSQPTAVTVSASGTAQGKRVIVLRFDQPSSRLSLGPVVIRGGQAQIEAKADFHSPDGKSLDPRGNAALRVSFEALDSQGKVIQRVGAQPSPSRPELGATIVLPVQGGQAAPFTIRCVSEDRSSGFPFQAKESQVVMVDPATAQRAPAVTATSSIRAGGGLAGGRVSCVVTVTARDGTPQERRAFLEALKARPPILSVRSTLGATLDTAAGSKAFDVKARTESDQAFIQEVAWASDPRPCAYEIALAKGQAAGVTYEAVKTTVQTVAGDALQLLVVAHGRRSGRVVLFDSVQQPSERGFALVGDRIALELVRGKDRLTAEEFTSLGGGLRARVVQEDGSVENVRLAQVGDRYVTEPKTFARPGRLLIQVDVAVEGLHVRLDGQIRIEPIAVRLVVSQLPVWQIVSPLPLGTAALLEATVAGTIRGQHAKAEDLLEAVEREGLHLEWVLVDSAGEFVARDRHFGSALSWRTMLRLDRTGDQTLRLQLVDHQDHAADTIEWKFRVLDSPLQLDVATRSAQGELVTLNPDGVQPVWPLRFVPFFVDTPSVVVVGRPSQSQVFTAYHVAGLRVGDTEASFNSRLGQFEATVTSASSVECTGILRPYGWRAATSEAPPELRVVARVKIPPYSIARWDRVALAGMGVLGLAGLRNRARRRRYRRSIERPGYRVKLFGAPGQAMLVVQPNQSGWLQPPSPEILVCRTQGVPDPLGLRMSWRAPDPGKGEVLATVRQHEDGSVDICALKDLPGLPAGQPRWLKAPGNDIQLFAQAITDRVQLVLMRPGDTESQTLPVTPLPQPKAASPVPVHTSFRAKSPSAD
jgi:hypothetical protein